MNAPARARLARGAPVLAARIAARADPAALDCEVLVVGSGYGGAVAAARLAGARRLRDDGQPGEVVRVWLLERGLEHPPGSFPARLGELPGEVRFAGGGRAPRGNAEGLFDLRLGDDVHVLLGNGLGGGSLINAGVMERPLPEVFRSGWPQGMDLDEPRLEQAYRRAETMLRPRRLPESAQQPPPAKLSVLRGLAYGALGHVPPAHDLRCRVTVSHDPGPSAAGVAMATCTRCGDCATGCNQGAKGSLDTSYLAWARRAGAELYTGGWVHHLQREVAAGCWIVHWRHTAGVLDEPPPLRARRVVLAAGSLGSTAILLRSREAGLQLSAKLGARFSTNGDQIAAIFRHRPAAHACRDEDRDPAPPPGSAEARQLNVGPTICGLVRARTPAGPIAVAEFAVPAPLRRVMGEVITSFGLLHQALGPGGALGRHEADVALDHDPLAVSHASLEHSSVIGMMGDDGAEGVMIPVAAARREPPHDGGLRIAWEKKGGTLGLLFDAQLAWLGSAAHVLGGTIVPAPTWQLLPRAMPLPGTEPVAVTVHPLGGCAMADDVTEGVVDADGCVFDPAGGVHSGLAVLDGAIVPRALAINPALTITALAERALPALAQRWRLRPRDADEPLAVLPPPLVAAPPRWQPQPAAARRTRFRVREQMHGLVQIGGRPLYAQLEVPAMDIADLGGLLPRADRRNPLSGAEAGRRRRATLRLYEPRVRDQLLEEDPDDGPLPPDPSLAELAELQLGGSLGLLLPLRPGCFQALGAVLRGARLLWQRRERGLVTDQPAALGARAVPSWRRLLAILRALLTLTRWRQLEYRMDVRTVRLNAADPSLGSLRPGSQLLGVKTLALTAGGNPWQQIGTLALHAVADDGTPGPLLGTLSSDLDYFVRHRQLLGRLTAQRDQPGAQADLAGMLLLTLRVFLFTHWPQFLPPGDTPPRVGERCVARQNGATVPTDTKRLPGGAHLHHYVAPGGAGSARPMLLIHGLSAAGSTFVHPAIPNHLVGLLLEDGRDAWVLDLRTSSALDPPRRGPFSFEQAATNDIPRAVARVREASGAARVDVFAHCIGAAMFCLAVLRRDRATLHGQIGSVVLSQVGPYARLSPFNRLRGFVAGFLQDYLGLAELDTRPELHYDAARKTGVDGHRGSGALAMADALLSTFPYPPEDREAQRAQALRRGQDFRRVRHRADGIIGHTLALRQVADETLLALDAIYGWVKTRTLAQVIHIARQGVLTHRDGNNESVSGMRLATRFRFPVLLLHGERNQVFDWRGSLQSYRSLCRAFDAEIDEPVVERCGDRHWGGRGPRQLHLLHDHGHQDVVIGCRLRERVYPVVRTFLETAAWPVAVDAPERSFVCGPPWMGPMIGHVREQLGAVDLALLVHAGTRRAETVGIVFVPLSADGRGWDGDATQAALLRIRPGGGGRRGAADPQRQLLQQRPLVLRFDAARAGARLPLHFAVLVLYRETRHPDGRIGPDDDGVDPARPLPPPGSALLVGEGLLEPAQAAVRAAMDRLLEEPSRLAAATLTVDQRVWEARDGRADAPARPALCFAVGSCQFPPALFDENLAGAAWRRLGRMLDGGGAAKAPAPQFMLLLGDQVYLDALGNVFQAPGRSAEDTARRAYEAVWQLPALRDVTRRLPLYPMLDDHEIANDWQPPPAGQPVPAADRAALLAYDRFQAKLAPAREPGGSYSYRFAPGGVPCFVLDTRTQRQARQPQAPYGAHLVDPAMLVRLRAWLDLHHAAPAKFIASPSFLLPIERPDLDDVEKLRLDGASGFPATQHAILSHVRDQGIRGVVLIGGDAHLSAVTTLAIDGGPSVVAVVSSGLYAPWPFANARPVDLLLDGPVVLHGGNGVPSLTGWSRCLALSTEQGVATFALRPRGGGTRLSVRLCRARGPAHDLEVEIDL